MKIYRGERTRDGAVVTVNGLPLAMRLDLWNHSPTGFEWGYGGSGPAQLALAILADCLGNDEEAVRYHQRFKFNVIAPIRENMWEFMEDEIREKVQAIKGEEKDD